MVQQIHSENSENGFKMPATVLAFDTETTALDGRVFELCVMAVPLFEACPELFSEKELVEARAKFDHLRAILPDRSVRRQERDCGVTPAVAENSPGWPRLHFFCYPGPDVEMSEASIRITGMDMDDVLYESEGIGFETYADQLLELIGGEVLVAHNAEFDIERINAEFSRIPGKEAVRIEKVAKIIDSLTMAQVIWPKGKRASLDALIKRYKIDQGERENRHGADIDTELLGQVFQRMMRDMFISHPINNNRAMNMSTVGKKRQKRFPIHDIPVTPDTANALPTFGPDSF